MVIATGIFGRMIGIFGGTFDPIHIGHVRTALDIFQDLALDEVRLIPCNVSPHRSAPLASGAQRLAMLLNEKEEPVRGIDDQRAGLMRGRIVDELAQIADRPELTGPVLILVGDVVSAGAISSAPAPLSELAAA